MPYTNNQAEWLFGDYDPKISPDGEWVAFDRHAEDWLINPNDPPGEWKWAMDFDLFLIPLEGEPGDEERLTGLCDGICFQGAVPNLQICPNGRMDGILGDFIPTWRPDGAKITFMTRVDYFGGDPDLLKKDHDIFILDPSNPDLMGDRGRTNLFENPEEEDANLDTSPSWFPTAPDGNPSTPDIVFDRKALEKSDFGVDLFLLLKKY